MYRLLKQNKKVASYLIDFASNNKYLRKDAKAEIYKIVIRQMLAHGAEARSKS